MSYSQSIPSERTFTVTNDASNFIFSGAATGSTPDISLEYGETYKFIIDCPGNNFVIADVFTQGTAEYAVTDGIYNNNIDSGILYYTVPADAPANLYYVNGVNSFNTGLIIPVYGQLDVARTNTFEEWRVKTNVIFDKFGDFSNLNTNFVATDAINALSELRTNLGELSDLDTDAQTSFVDSINELEANFNTLDAAAQLEGDDLHVANLFIDSGNSTLSHAGTKIQLSEVSGSLSIVSETVGPDSEILSILSNSTNKIFSIDGSGDAVFAGDITAFGSFSDINMKENIEPITDALDKVCQINGYTFDFKEEFIKNDKQKNKQVGVIAQELEKVLPELVHEAPDGYKRVDYDRIVALLIEAVKELNNKIK